MDSSPESRREPADTAEQPKPGAYRDECEVCGNETYGLHCKIVCPNCGYRRDCSDP